MILTKYYPEGGVMVTDPDSHLDPETTSGPWYLAEEVDREYKRKEQKITRLKETIQNVNRQLSGSQKLERDLHDENLKLKGLLEKFTGKVTPKGTKKNATKIPPKPPMTGGRAAQKRVKKAVASKP